jgi:Mn2+/Fe2+ NRAMP family transporter
MQPLVDQKVSPPGGILVRGKWSRRLLTFLMVLGPGLIVMEADNDAGAVSTYTQAGGQFGTSFLWILLLLLPVCYFIQEMVVRLGIATGEGHAAMIYKRFGKWWGHFSLFDLQLLNYLTLVTEFAAVDLAFSKMGLSPYVAVPMVAVAMIAIVSSASYRRWEAVTIVLCLLDVTWMALAWHVGPPVHEVILKTLVPSLPRQGLTSDYVFLVIATIGTTIAPWQLFFQQSCVADKRLRFKDLKWARLDTFLGACFTILVAGCMVLVGDAAFRWGLGHGGYAYADPAQLADYLGALRGPWVRNAILLLMVNAAMLGTTAISLSSAWAYGEVKGLPSSLNFGPKEAPGFYAVYALVVLSAAGLVLIPHAPLQLIIMGVQVLAGIMLPSAVIFLQLLLNDRELLGDDFVNKPWNNWVNWTIIVVLFALSLVLAAQIMVPTIFPQVP